MSELQGLGFKQRAQATGEGLLQEHVLEVANVGELCGNFLIHSAVRRDRLL